MQWKIFYDLTSGTIHVGNKHGNPVPQILLGGIGIHKNHAYFEYFDDEELEEDKSESLLEEERKPNKNWKNVMFFLRPFEPSACDQIYHNGKKIDVDGVMLNHNDRISFGNFTYFVFKNPDKGLENYKEA